MIYESEFNNKKHTIVKRPGRIMGAQGVLFHVLHEDATVVILSNTDATSLDEFAAEISKRILWASALISEESERYAKR